MTTIKSQRSWYSHLAGVSLCRAVFAWLEGFQRAHRREKSLQLCDMSYLLQCLLSHCLNQPPVLAFPRNLIVNLPYKLLKSGLAWALFSAVSFLSYAAKHGKSPSVALEDAVGSPVNIMSLVCSCFLGVSGHFAKTFCMTMRAWNCVDTRVGNDGSDCFPT